MSKNKKPVYVDLFGPDKTDSYSNYKTVMCKNWEKNGSCTYKKCTFAHGKEELKKYRDKANLKSYEDEYYDEYGSDYDNEQDDKEPFSFNQVSENKVKNKAKREKLDDFTEDLWSAYP